jgi:hypothetical protein
MSNDSLRFSSRLMTDEQLCSMAICAASEHCASSAAIVSIRSPGVLAGLTLRSALGREFGVVGKQFLCLSGVALSTNIAQIELYELDLRAHLNDSIRSSQKVSVACPGLQYQHSLQAIGALEHRNPPNKGSQLLSIFFSMALQALLKNSCTGNGMKESILPVFK